MKLTISRKQAVKLALLQDPYLIHPHENGTVDDTLKIIQKLGHVQIDTISVIERAHHHVLWTRNRGYHPDHLNILQTENRRIFEYWAHAAAYLPAEAYRFCLPQMKRIRENGHDWYRKNDKLMRAVYDRIIRNGPLSSLDFDHYPAENKTGWGTHKPSKHALENLFMSGVLAVTRRENFRKIYDVAERVYPENGSVSFPTDKELADYLIRKCTGSPGLFSYKDIVYNSNSRSIKQLVKGVLAEKTGSLELIELEIEGCSKSYFIETAVYEQSKGKRVEPFIRLLSPFDNQVINRERLVDIYNFTYSLECYIPAAKRKFGYFALPILSDKGFIGTIDLKADRKAKRLIIQKVIFEKDPSAKELKMLQRELTEFADFNKCRLEDTLI